MRKVFVCKKAVKFLEGRKGTIIYSVTVDELSCGNDVTGIESYGVSVAICESREEAFVRNITLNGSDIFSLAMLLASNRVTPVALRDVVSDWLLR